MTLSSNPITFPLDQSLYVDATHDTVIVHILTALNLTILGEEGPLRADKLKRGRKWRASKIVPFASNVQFQCKSTTITHYLFHKLSKEKNIGSPTSSVLSCPSSGQHSSSSASSTANQIRVILNDAVVSLTGIEGCHSQKDGLCPLDKFIKSQKKLVERSDWEWTCYGNWSVPEGDAWHTVTGDPPGRP